MSGMDKIVAFDQSQNIDDSMPLSSENRVVTLRSNLRQKA
jgi:hypothetical protein